jgi:hypothetical protein
MYERNSNPRGNNLNLLPHYEQQSCLAVSRFLPLLSCYTADSGEAAQAFRFDGARCSDGMSPRARSLAG